MSTEYTNIYLSSVTNVKDEVLRKDLVGAEEKLHVRDEEINSLCFFPLERRAPDGRVCAGAGVRLLARNPLLLHVVDAAEMHHGTGGGDVIGCLTRCQ